MIAIIFKIVYSSTSSFTFVIIFDDAAFRLKGSDASWEHDEEPPQEVSVTTAREPPVSQHSR